MALRADDPVRHLLHQTREAGVTTSLAARLAQRIKAEGPMTVADYMAAVAENYYARADVFGAQGDFITAPEISQAFGELAGLWCAIAWQRMGSPTFHLVECGPGRGTLMADALRATARVKGFHDAMTLHLVERSAARRAEQAERLGAFKPCWHDDLSAVPNGPMILIGNEFLDALPVRQFEKTTDGWAERAVTVDSAGTFQFTTLPTDITPALTGDVGAICEQSPAITAFVKSVSQRIVKHGGAALFIDYGYKATALGDTLQAVKAHKPHPILNDPGTADLTAHVDFAAVRAAALKEGAKVLGPVEQGTWLKRLGIAVRAVQLAAGKDAATARTMAQGIARLTEPDQMGALFKVVALTHPSLEPLDGFDQDAAP